MRTRAIILIILLSQLCPAATTVINSFSSGELSPLLEGRTDVKRYYSGCRTLENFVVLAQGGVTKRPGTYYIADAKDADVACRLIPFEYSTEQAYILEMGDEYLRFYKDGGQILGNEGTETLTAVDGGALVAHWLLNEDEGVTVVNDDDAGTYDGTATVDASTLHETGKVGTGCFDLDTQYTVEIADADVFSFTDNSDDSAFSIACWAYITQQSDVQVLLSKWRDQDAAKEWRFSLDKERKLQLHLADTQADLSSDRVAQWKLNEAASNKTVLDDTANNHDGATQTDDTVDLSATGKIDKCLDFGGADAVVLDADADALSFTNDTADSVFSIVAWVYATGNNGDEVILSKVDLTIGSMAREWKFYFNEGKLRLLLYDENTNAHIGANYTSLLTGWHFVAATYDATEANTGISLYVDGIELTGDDIARSSEGTYVAMQNTATTVKIGAQEGTAGTLTSYFQNKIDNVILFDIELTQANITALWNDGGGTETMADYGSSAVSDDAISLGWHFLVVTYDAPAVERTAGDGIILYVDGVVVDSTATNDADYKAMQNAGEAVRIGSQNNVDNDADEKFWGDKIDEVSVFSDVLTPTEVASLRTTPAYEIETVFGTAELFATQYVQSADELYLVHPDHPPQKLVRYSHNYWEIGDVNLVEGPFLEENKTTTTITPSATTGNITLTASTAIFNSNHVGALWQITHTVAATTNNDELDAVDETTTEVTVQVGRDYELTTGGTWAGDIVLQRTYDSGTTWKDVVGHHLESGGDNLSYASSETVDDAVYRVKMLAFLSGDCNATLTALSADVKGVVQIDGYTSPTVVSAKVKHTLGGIGAVKTWAEGAWSDDEGYPSCITFYEERQAYAATTNKSQTIWMSQTDDWVNFTTGADDTDALALTIASDKVDTIRWMSPQSRLLLGTLGSEWSLSASGENEPITPTNLVARRQSTYGSANIQAIVMNNIILFVQRQDQKIRSLKYSFELDNWIAPDLTLLSEHITGEGVTSLALQNSPYPILWAVREDGDLIGLTLEDSQEVIGWHRHTLDGDVESIAVIPGDNEDEIWMSIERVIDSNTVRYIEQIQPFDWGSDQNDIFFVDSGLTYDGAETNSVSGLGHLEGETVTVVGNGVYAQTAVVSGGIITLDAAYSCMQVGLPYTSKLLPMKLEIVTSPGALFGQTKRITEVTARLYETLGCKIGTSWTDYDEFVFVDEDTAYSGDVDIEFDGDYETAGSVYIQSNEPTPITVLAIMVRFEKED